MKALATALAILTISAPAFADESFIKDEPTLSEPEKSEQHAAARHALELSDEQMDGVIAAGLGTVWPVRYKGPTLAF